MLILSYEFISSLSTYVCPLIFVLSILKSLSLFIFKMDSIWIKWTCFKFIFTYFLYKKIQQKNSILFLHTFDPTVLCSN